MQLGETIATYDLGLALRGESGKFEVTSPAGEIYHVTCQTEPFQFQSRVTRQSNQSSAIPHPQSYGNGFSGGGKGSHRVRDSSPNRRNSIPA